MRSAVNERHCHRTIQIHAAYGRVAHHEGAAHRSQRPHQCEPQPSLYLFTGGHYSILSVNSDQPRPDLPQDTSKATAADLNSVWGPLTANSGTYEIKGGTLTTHPMVAKNPAVMASGNAFTTSFKIEGKTLTLTTITGLRGPVTNPTTLTLTRVE